MYKYNLLLKMITLRKINVLNMLGSSVNFSTNGVLRVNPKWMESRWVPPKTNATLVDLPDYTFLDQRPTPYGAGQRRRIDKQKKYTARIVQLTSEIDHALNLYKQKEAAKQASIDERISKKLTEKGIKTVGD